MTYSPTCREGREPVCLICLGHLPYPHQAPHSQINKRELAGGRCLAEGERWTRSPQSPELLFLQTCYLSLWGRSCGGSREMALVCSIARRTAPEIAVPIPNFCLNKTQFQMTILTLNSARLLGGFPKGFREQAAPSHVFPEVSSWPLSLIFSKAFCWHVFLNNKVGWTKEQTVLLNQGSCGLEKFLRSKKLSKLGPWIAFACPLEMAHVSLCHCNKHSKGFSSTDSIKCLYSRYGSKLFSSPWPLFFTLVSKFSSPWWNTWHALEMQELRNSVAVLVGLQF